MHVFPCSICYFLRSWQNKYWIGFVFCFRHLFKVVRFLSMRNSMPTVPTCLCISHWGLKTFLGVCQFPLPSCFRHFLMYIPYHFQLKNVNWSDTMYPFKLGILFVCLLSLDFLSHSRIFNSYVWGRHHYRWKDANFDLCSALRPLSSEGSLVCTIYCDTGHPFIMAISEDSGHSHLLLSV